MPDPTTITIGSHDYTVYGDTHTVDDYAEGAIHSAGWDALTEEAKPKYCVTATRTMERQKWAGSKTEDDQVLAWPRTGLTYIDGSEVDASEIPQQVIDGFCEICLALANGSELQDVTSTENAIASLAAGSVSITYFRGAGGTPTRFPTVVQELLGLWLASQENAVSASSSGTCGESAFEDDFSINQGL